MTTLEESFFAAADEQYASLVNSLSSPEAQRWEHSQVESHINQFGTELMRRLFQAHLDQRYAQETYQTDVVGSDGQTRPHRRKKTQRQLETLFGEVVVSRVGYSTQTPGVSALYPQDGTLNLAPDKYSDGLRRRVAEESSKVSFAETSESIAKTTGATIGKRQCEEVSVSVAQDFDAFYAQRTPPASASANDLLVITTDGKGIVMHSKDLRAATAKAAAKAKGSKQTRLSPGQKRQRKRMATVASVYSVARFERQAEDIIGTERDPPERPPIHNKRVWADVRQDAKTVIGSAFEEAQRRDPEHQQDWVVLVDGEENQLNYVKAAAKKLGVEVNIVLDFAMCWNMFGKRHFAFLQWVAKRLKTG